MGGKNRREKSCQVARGKGGGHHIEQVRPPQTGAKGKERGGRRVKVGEDPGAPPNVHITNGKGGGGKGRKQAIKKEKRGGGGWMKKKPFWTKCSQDKNKKRQMQRQKCQRFCSSIGGKEKERVT